MKDLFQQTLSAPLHRFVAHNFFLRCPINTFVLHVKCVRIYSVVIYWERYRLLPRVT